MKMPVIAAAAALMAVPAGAQPPPKGWVGPLSTPSILCDTRAQVESIVEAFGQGTEAGAERFAELFRTMNHRSEPTCAVAALRTVVAIGSTDLGQLDIGGEEFFGWIVHIENNAGEGFYLYLESPFDALKNTI